MKVVVVVVEVVGVVVEAAVVEVVEEAEVVGRMVRWQRLVLH